MFITFDGKHGTGKTFLLGKLADSLEKLGKIVFVTSEPTAESLGVFAREAENIFSGESLVCLFAADRYEHVKLIKKKLQENYLVLCDRYIFSAIVLQNMDNVPVDFICEVNKNILIPDMSVIVCGSSDIVKRNVLSRTNISRLAFMETNENRDRYLENLHIFEKMTRKIIVYENDFQSYEKFISKIHSEFELHIQGL